MALNLYKCENIILLNIKFNSRTILDIFKVYDIKILSFFFSDVAMNQNFNSTKKAYNFVKRLLKMVFFFFKWVIALIKYELFRK